jgi:hypothetical protein
MYAYKPSGGTWTTTTIDPFAEGVAHSTLLLDPANGLHISYTATGDGDLMYAYKPSGGTWTETTIDPFAAGVVHSSLLLDPANRIHIVYSVSTDDDLKYATHCF